MSSSASPRGRFRIVARLRATFLSLIAAVVVVGVAACGSAPSADPASPAGRYLAAAAKSDAVQGPLIARFRAAGEDLGTLQPLAAQLANSYGAFVADVAAIRASAPPDATTAIDDLVRVETALQASFRAAASAKTYAAAAAATANLTDLFRQESVAANAVRQKLGLPAAPGPGNPGSS